MNLPGSLFSKFQASSELALVALLSLTAMTDNFGDVDIKLRRTLEKIKVKIPS